MENQKKSSILQSYRNISMFYKILGGFVLGIIIGIVAGDHASNLAFLGQIMVRLMTMVVIPIVLCMMVTAVGTVGSKAVGKMGLLATLLFTFTTPVAIGFGLFFANIFNVGYGIPAPVSETEIVASTPPTLIQTIVSIFPDNIFAAMTSADLLQVMVFSILIGVAISSLPNKEHRTLISNIFQGFGDVMSKVLAMTMGFMPIGVMGIIASIVGPHGIESLLPFTSFIGATYANALAIFFILQVFFLSRVIGGLSMKKYLKNAKEPLLFAYATNSSFATLPLAVKAATKMGFSKKVVNFTVPYGIVVNMDGSASYMAIATIFIARVYGIDLSLLDIIMLTVASTLASFGAAGTPGGAVIMLNSVLLMLGLPLDAVVLLIGFDRLLIGPVRAFLNVSGDFAVCAVVDRFTKNDKYDEEEAELESVAPQGVVAVAQTAQVNTGQPVMKEPS